MSLITTGEVHAANAASSSRHSKPSAASLALNAKRALCSGEMSPGDSTRRVENGSGVAVAVAVAVSVAVGTAVGWNAGGVMTGAGAPPPGAGVVGAGVVPPPPGGAAIVMDDAARQLLVSLLSLTLLAESAQTSTVYRPAARPVGGLTTSLPVPVLPFLIAFWDAEPSLTSVLSSLASVDRTSPVVDALAAAPVLLTVHVTVVPAIAALLMVRSGFFAA